MKRKTALLLMTVGCGAFLAGGCAKKEVIQKDEPMASSVSVATPAIVKPQQEKVQPKGGLPTPAAKVEPKAPAGPKVGAVKADPSEQLKKGLEKVFFNFDSAALSDQARQSLVKDADLMKETEKTKIRVEGNCDERGSDDYNLALGEKRAKAALQYLVSLGIPAERIASISYGKEKPVATGHDEASWNKNRRDDFVVVP